MSNMNPESNLTPGEIESLDRLEAVAQHGLDAYATVGNALAEIHDRGLYRHTSPTFEDYLRQRWGVDLVGADRRPDIALDAGEPATAGARQAPQVPAVRSKPCEALAKACEQTLSALGSDEDVDVEISVAVRKPRDGAEPADLSPWSISKLVDEELVPRLRWLLTQASGTIADAAHQLETEAGDIDDDAYEELRDDVLVLDQELRALKGLLAGLIDWDAEFTRLLEDEIPPPDEDDNSPADD